MGTLSLVGLGSNLGDRHATLDAAVAALADAAGVSLRGVSTYRETAPVGGPGGQGAFLNAAAALETTLEPAALHGLLLDVERRAGRVREVRWSARTLDLDLLLFGDRIIDTPELTVPHPRMAVRRFVLAPLAEVAPGARDPLTRRTVADLLANLDRRPSYVALDLPHHLAPSVFRRVSEELSAIGLATEDDREPVSPRTPRRSPEPEPPDRFERTARELRADRWSPSRWGDRWVITDYWFDRLYLDHLEDAGPARIDDVRGRFLSARSMVLQPTFVVSTRRPIAHVIPADEGAEQGDVPIGPEAPTLLVTEDDAIAADVVAACESIRPRRGMVFHTE